jgi:hypothetical protein
MVAGHLFAPAAADSEASKSEQVGTPYLLFGDKVQRKFPVHNPSTISPLQHNVSPSLVIKLFVPDGHV